MVTDKEKRELIRRFHQAAGAENLIAKLTEKVTALDPKTATVEDVAMVLLGGSLAVEGALAESRQALIDAGVESPDD